MAAITISSSVLNPTSDYLPKKSGNKFVDSPLQSIKTSELKSIFNNSYVGLSLDNVTGYFELGDFNNVNNGTIVRVNDSGGYIELLGSITVTGGVHNSSGKYLNIRVNGTSYFLNLLT
jgi:hypothetical protein